MWAAAEGVLPSTWSASVSSVGNSRTPQGLSTPFLCGQVSYPHGVLRAASGAPFLCCKAGKQNAFGALHFLRRREICLRVRSRL